MGLWRSQESAACLLREEFARVAPGASRLVVLAGEPGVGATRVVQEFYRDLVARSGEGIVWPSEIAGDAALVTSEVVRGRVHPRGELGKTGGVPWLWLGLSCRLEGFGDLSLPADERVPVAALDDNVQAVEQFTSLTVEVSRVDLAAGVWGLAQALAGLVPGAGTAVTGKDLVVSGAKVTGELARMARQQHQARRAAPLAVLGVEYQRRAQRVAKTLGEFGALGVPVVLVVDRAHWADEETTVLVEQMLGDESVDALVIATGWRSELLDQQHTSEGFGRVLADRKHTTLVEIEAPSGDELAATIAATRPGTTSTEVTASVGSHPLSAAEHLAAPGIAWAGVQDCYLRRWNELDPTLQRVLAADAMLGEVHVAIVRDADHLGDYPAHHRRLHDIGVLVAHDTYRSGFASHHWHQIALDHAPTVLGPDLDAINRAAIAEITDWLNDDDWTPPAVTRTLLTSQIRLLNSLNPPTSNDLEALAAAQDRLADLEADTGHPNTAAAASDLAIAATFALANLDGWVDPETVRHRQLARLRLTALGNDHTQVIRQAEALVTQAVQQQRPPVEIAGAKWNLAKVLAGFHEYLSATAVTTELLDHLDGLSEATQFAIRDDLALWFGEAGLYDDAVSNYEALVGDLQRVVGPDHPVTLRTRNSLARWYGEAGRFGDAIAVLKALLPVVHRVYGGDSSSLLTIQYNLATVQGQNGHQNDAITTLEALLKDQGRILGRDHQATLNSRLTLAEFYGEAGHPGKAVTTLEALVPDARRVLADDHPITLAARSLLGGWYGGAGRLDDAIRALEALVPDARRVLGDDHPITLAARDNLDRWHNERDRRS